MSQSAGREFCIGPVAAIEQDAMVDLLLEEHDLLTEADVRELIEQVCATWSKMSPEPNGKKKGYGWRSPRKRRLHWTQGGIMG